MTSRIIKVTLPKIGLEEQLWSRFMMLPEPVRNAYLGRMLSDSLEDLLDKNPEMLGWLMSRYAKEKRP
jgi:hypothetical protein